MATPIQPAAQPTTWQGAAQHNRRLSQRQPLSIPPGWPHAQRWKRQPDHVPVLQIYGTAPLKEAAASAMTYFQHNWDRAAGKLAMVRPDGTKLKGRLPNAINSYAHTVGRHRPGQQIKHNIKISATQWPRLQQCCPEAALLFQTATQVCEHNFGELTLAYVMLVEQLSNKPGTMDYKLHRDRADTPESKHLAASCAFLLTEDPCSVLAVPGYGQGMTKPDHVPYVNGAGSALSFSAELEHEVVTTDATKLIFHFNTTVSSTSGQIGAAYGGVDDGRTVNEGTAGAIRRSSTDGRLYVSICTPIHMYPDTRACSYYTCSCFKLTPHLNSSYPTPNFYRTLTALSCCRTLRAWGKILFWPVPARN